MSEFLNAINEKSDAQENITEKEWDKIIDEKETILSSIKDPQLKNQFNNNYEQLDDYFSQEGEQVYNISNREIQDLKELLVDDKEFTEKRLNIISEFYGVDISEIEKAYNQNYDLSVVGTLEKYKNYIELELGKLPEGCDISSTDKEKLLQNIKKIIVGELPQNYKGENKWLLNGELIEKYSKVFESVFKSAKFYIFMHTPKYKERFDESFKNKYFTLHVNSRLKDIEESLLADNIDGDISTGMLFNDNLIIDFLSQGENDRDDRVITNFDFGEGSINDSINNKKIEDITFLNEKDADIEKMIGYKMLGLSLISSITPIDTIYDFGDTFSSEDYTLKTLKQIQKKIDVGIPKGYKQSKPIWENALSGFALVPFIGNIGDAGQVLRKLKKVGKLDMGLLKKSLNEVGSALGIQQGIIGKITDNLQDLVDGNVNIDEKGIKILEEELKKSIGNNSDKLKITGEGEFVVDSDSTFNELLNKQVQGKSDFENLLEKPAQLKPESKINFDFNDSSMDEFIEESNKKAEELKKVKDKEKSDFDKLLDESVQTELNSKINFDSNDKSMNEFITKNSDIADELISAQKTLKSDIKEINNKVSEIYDKLDNVGGQIGQLGSVAFPKHMYNINTILNKLYTELIDLRKLHRVKQKELSGIEEKLDFSLIKTPEEIVNKMVKSLNIFENGLDIMFKNIFGYKTNLQKRLDKLPFETKQLDGVDEFEHIAS